MCDRCGAVGRHDFAVVERPAETLRGLTWEGTYAEAAAGAIHPLIEEMKSRIAGEGDVWNSAIIGISWNDRADGFRYFVGTATKDDVLPPGLHFLSLPAMRFASAWHGPDDGDVVQHYGRMFDWIEAEVQRHDVSVMHQREEYPSDTDLAAPPVLRLMLPIAPGPVSCIGMSSQPA